MSANYQFPEAIVTSQWLAENLDDPGLRIFECTTYLLYRPAGSAVPYDVGSGREHYLQAHIPGAGFLDLQNDLSDNSAPLHLRFRMLPAAALAQAFAAQGVGDEHRIILYTRGPAQWATRVWWMLHSIGFDNVAVLDGGWENWQSEQRASDSGVVSFAPSTLACKPRAGVFVAKEQVQDAMANESACVLNALAPDLHSGENDRYGRAGRIPGSVNVPASALLDAQTNTMVAPDIAKSAFDAVGIRREGPTVIYCGGGIAATMDAFLMRQLGYQNISIYDASMSEWAKDESLPIERD